MAMNGVIEALHVYDDKRNALLSHMYAGRPLPAAQVLPLYLEHPAPRPSLIHLANATPPTLVFSLTHSNLLFLASSSAEIEPLLVLEFLHRVVDALEDFLGAPLLAVKLENNYDVVAQLLTEMCDSGIVSTTEPNALRDMVEMEGWVGKLLGSISLPGKVPSNPNPPSSLGPALAGSGASALPWRRANVRHTSNELYADIVESLSVTLAPSGRPLAAFAHGTIAFTAKVSGVPDITLSLATPSGRHNIGSIMELPVLHPCVRLNRWRERPGELSFVPPDGRFILAAYEVDLLPSAGEMAGSLGASHLKLPVELEMRTGLGSTGLEFEARLQVHRLPGASSSAGGVGRLAAPHPGSPGAPVLDDLRITIPLPEEVRNLSHVRPSRGDASFNPTDRKLEWHVPAKELLGSPSQFILHCTVVGLTAAAAAEEELGLDAVDAGPDKDYLYDEPYQGGSEVAAAAAGGAEAAAGREKGGAERQLDAKKVAQNKMLMPTSASISFSVKGWLASRLKVEAITLDTRKSRGLGEGVRPYKGVKYLTVSKGGVELRC